MGLRKPFILILLLISVFTAAAEENFFDSYSESERYMIADAYLAVGNHYGELGEGDKSQAYKNMAGKIFPGIGQGDVPVQKPAAAADEKKLASVPERPTGKEPAAVQYYFGKLFRAVFSENAEDVISLLSTRLFLPGYDEGIKNKEVREYVLYAFDRYEIDKADPSRIYKTDRISIRPEGSSWTAGIGLTDAGKAFFAGIGFPGDAQKFYFREYREGWRLIAISAE